MTYHRPNWRVWTYPLGLLQVVEVKISEELEHDSSILLELNVRFSFAIALSLRLGMQLGLDLVQMIQQQLSENQVIYLVIRAIQSCQTRARFLLLGLVVKMSI